MGLDFVWTPNQIKSDPPTYPIIQTEGAKFSKQSLLLSGSPARKHKLIWNNALPAVREKILWHFNYHYGQHASFTWKDIPSYVDTPNLIPPASQTFIANADSSQYWAAYDSSSITLTQNQAGPDGELSATRIQATAGAGAYVTKYMFKDTRANGLAGEIYQFKAWAKKYSAASPSFNLYLNVTGGQYQTISSETWEEIDLSGANTTTQTRQVNLRAASISGTINAVLAYPYLTYDELTVRYVSHAETPTGPFNYDIEVVFEEVL